MNRITLTLMVFLLSNNVMAELATDYKLPENGKIQTAILSGSFSCKDAGAFTPLNLNGDTYHKGTYYPDLQINFGCGGTPLLEGTDLSLIADIGDKRLDELDTLLSMKPIWRSGESHNFRKSASIKENNSYAMMLNTFKFRGILVFRVISYRENVLTIQYATREYSLIEETKKSAFIDHEKKNFR